MRTLAPEHVIDFCGVQLIVFRAAEAGDGLPLHSHSFDHLVFALAGVPEAFFDDGSVHRLCVGALPLRLTAGKQHGVRATAAGDRFANVMPLPDGL